MIDWTKIKEDPRDYLVYERARIFEARLITRASRNDRRKRLGPLRLVVWGSEDERKAQDCLRDQALKYRCEKAQGCIVCAWQGPPRLMYACMSGEHYCSGRCYDTLFLNCTACGTRSMDALTNTKMPSGYVSCPEWYGPDNQLCSACHRKKHNYGIACISFR